MVFSIGGARLLICDPDICALHHSVKNYFALQHKILRAIAKQPSDLDLPVGNSASAIGYGLPTE